MLKFTAVSVRFHSSAPVALFSPKSCALLDRVQEPLATVTQGAAVKYTVPVTLRAGVE